MLIVVLALVGLGLLPGSALGSSFLSLPRDSVTTAISPDGEVVVGVCRGCFVGSTPSVPPSVVWTRGIGSPLRAPAGAPSHAFVRSVPADLSLGGRVIVGEFEGRAVRWVDGIAEFLSGLPTHDASTATAVSDDGTMIAGWLRRGSSVEAFRWADGVADMLSDPGHPVAEARALDISGDGRVIVGSADGRAFRFVDGRFERLESFPVASLGSEARAVSFDGSVIAGTVLLDPRPSPDFRHQAMFLWRDGVMTIPLESAGLDHRPNGLSSNGSVVVGGMLTSVSFDREERAPFLWSEKSGFVRLDAEPFVPAFNTLGEAIDVSADGKTITGLDITASPRAWVLALAEPSSSVLTLLALAGIGLLRRRAATMVAVVALTVGSSAQAAQKIYWTELGTIRRANPDRTGIEDIVVPYSDAPDSERDLVREIALGGGKSSSRRFTFDPVGGHSFEIGFGGNILRDSDLLLDGLFAPEHLRVDPTGGFIYWFERGTGRIRRAQLDGTGTTDLVTGLATCPVCGPGLDLDVDAAKLYWNDAQTGAVFRANLDGSSPEQILALEAPGPTALLVDGSTQTLYLARSQGRGLGRVALSGGPVGQIGWGAIQSIHLDGQRARLLLRTDLDWFEAGPDGSDLRPLRVTAALAFALDPIRGRIYWTTFFDVAPPFPSFLMSSASRAGLDGSGIEHLAYFSRDDWGASAVTVDLRRGEVFASYDARPSADEDTEVYQVKEGTFTNRIVAYGKNYGARAIEPNLPKTPIVFDLVADRLLAVSLLLASALDLDFKTGLVSLDPYATAPSPLNLQQITPSGDAYSMAVEPRSAEGSRIYWTDGLVIRRFDPVEGVGIVVQSSSIRGVAVDAAAAKLYWVEASSSRIMRSELDGTAAEVFLDGLQSPVHVAALVVPDVSPCGDLDGSGGLESTDVARLRALMLGQAGESNELRRCSVIGTALDCDAQDWVVLARTVHAPPLPPGRIPACDAALGR